MTNAPNKVCPSFSACFVPVDHTATTIKLKELKVVGMQAMLGDVIMTLDPTTTEQNGQYCYYSAEEAASYPGTESMVGWWKGGWGVEPADDVEIAVGTAFLGQIINGGAIDLQSAGEAPTYTTKYTTDGSAFPFFGNYIPKDLKLKDIVVTGMQAMLGDVIMTLDPETSEQNGQYCYYSAEEAAQYPGTESMIGWWKGGWGVEPADDTPVPAGTAFLGQIINTSDPIEFKFPSVLKTDAE